MDTIYINLGPKAVVIIRDALDFAAKAYRDDNKDKYRCEVLRMVFQDGVGDKSGGTRVRQYGLKSRGFDTATLRAEVERLENCYWSEDPRPAKPVDFSPSQWATIKVYVGRPDTGPVCIGEFDAKCPGVIDVTDLVQPLLSDAGHEDLTDTLRETVELGPVGPDDNDDTAVFVAAGLVNVTDGRQVFVRAFHRVT